jgi:hypothetical protein
MQSYVGASEFEILHVSEETKTVLGALQSEGSAKNFLEKGNAYRIL